MRSLAAAGVFLFVLTGAAESGSMADKSAEASRRVIEVSEPGLYADSDCVFRLTGDITAKSTALTFTGSNYVVDLNGKTLTFNTEHKDYPRKMRWVDRTPDALPTSGVLLQGKGVELTNGTIIQAAGQDTNSSCVIVLADGCDLHNTTTVISGGHKCRNFLGMLGGNNVKLHHNYLVNNASAKQDWYGAITVAFAGPNWEIHHNTIVGGHQGVVVQGRRGTTEAVRIHHNCIQHKRTRSQKVPQGVYIRASGCEIDHNEIVTIDGRGLEPTGNDNYWHDNIVDIRYTTQAAGGFYPENRCYGYWARNPNGNRIINNLFVVTNEVLDDPTSNTIGIMLVTDPGRKTPLRNSTVIGNRLFINHQNKDLPAWGVKLTNVGDEVIFKDNFIWARTAAATITDQAKGVTFEGNTLVRAGKDWQAWAVFDGETGKGVAATTFKNNKIIDPPNDKKAPAAPAGLKITARINGFELHWNANSEPDALGYYVYRDGKRVEDRLKCGRFYVDTAVKAPTKCKYAVSAVDTSGNEGPKCPAVSTP